MKKIAIIIIFVFSVIGMKAQVFQEWTARYNGVDSLFDWASAIDAHNCIYVTGTTMQFNQTYHRNEYHIVILRYNTKGATLWAVVDTNIDASARAIVTDNNCNIYITGSRNINGNVDFFTSKYDSAGVKQWEAFYDDPQHNSDYANSIVIDNTGSNIYVAGNSTAGTTLVKYSSSGVQQWVANYNVNTGMGSPQVLAIAIDAGNNIYMTGYKITSNSSVDYLTLKYNSNGVQQWVAFYNGTGNGSDVAFDIATDKNDNVYVTGTSTNVNNNADYATIKYNKNGIQQWVARYDDSGNGYDNAIAIAIDSKGNIDVFGTYSSSTTAGYATVQYSKNGTLKWVQLYNGPAPTTNATAMALDTAGNIYVTGMSQGIGTSYDYATIKYMQKGDLAWVMRYNGTANGYDYPAAIAVDARANVYVTGYSQGIGTGYDIVTVKYSDISNPNNPFDFVGKYHNMGLDYVLNNYDTSIKGTYRGIKIGLLAKDFVNANLTEINKEQTKAFKIIQGKAGNTITDSCDIYLRYISKLADNIDTSNFSIFIDSLMLLETKVLNDNNLNKTEKEIILGTTSVARYSTSYWSTPHNNMEFDIHHHHPSWWVVADILGGAIGGALASPTGVGIGAGIAIGAFLGSGIAVAFFGSSYNP